MFWVFGGIAAYYIYKEFSPRQVVLDDTVSDSIQDNPMSLHVFDSLGYMSTANGRYLEQVQKLKREDFNSIVDVQKKYIDRHTIPKSIFEENVLGSVQQIRDNQVFKDASSFGGPMPLKGIGNGSWYIDAISGWQNKLVNENPANLPKI